MCFNTQVSHVCHLPLAGGSPTGMARLKAELKTVVAELAAANGLIISYKAQIAGFEALRDVMIQKAKAEAKEEMTQKVKAQFIEGSNYAKEMIKEARGWK